jgi:hypothetical protein
VNLKTVSCKLNVWSSYRQLSISKLWNFAHRASAAHLGAWSKGRQILFVQMLWFVSWGIGSSYHFVAVGEPSCSYSALTQKGGMLGILELHPIANYGARNVPCHHSQLLSWLRRWRAVGLCHYTAVLSLPKVLSPAPTPATTNVAARLFQIFPNLAPPKPPKSFGMHTVGQFTRQCPPLAFSPFQRKYLLSLSIFYLAHTASGNTVRW